MNCRNRLATTVEVSSDWHYASEPRRQAIAEPVDMTAQQPFSVSKRDSFQVAGISARTTNALESTPQGKIPALWAQLFAEKLLPKISHRIDSTIAVLYTSYHSDRTQAYDYVLGAHVQGDDVLQPGMSVYAVPEGIYATFAGSGEPQATVLRIWQSIWAAEDAGDIERAYLTDYELHELSADGSTTQVAIHVGIRS